MARGAPRTPRLLPHVCAGAGAACAGGRSHSTCLVCMCAHNHCPPGRHPAAVCAGIAMCRRVQACSGSARRRSRSTKMPARVQSCHMRVQAHAHRWRHMCHCQGPAGLGAGAGHSPWGAPRQGWGEASWGSQPSAMCGGSSMLGSGGPTGPGPSCNPPPPRDPLPAPGPPYGPGPNSSQMGWGGVAFQSLRLEQTLLPPRRAVARPRPLTPTRQCWQGRSCPLCQGWWGQPHPHHCGWHPRSRVAGVGDPLVRVGVPPGVDLGLTAVLAGEEGLWGDRRLGGSQLGRWVVGNSSRHGAEPLCGAVCPLPVKAGGLFVTGQAGSGQAAPSHCGRFLPRAANSRDGAAGGGGRSRGCAGRGDAEGLLSCVAPGSAPAGTAWGAGAAEDPCLLSLGAAGAGWGALAVVQGVPACGAPRPLSPVPPPIAPWHQDLWGDPGAEGSGYLPGLGAGCGGEAGAAMRP